MIALAKNSIFTTWAHERGGVWWEGMTTSHLQNASTGREISGAESQNRRSESRHPNARFTAPRHNVRPRSGVENPNGVPIDAIFLGDVVRQRCHSFSCLQLELRGLHRAQWVSEMTHRGGERCKVRRARWHADLLRLPMVLLRTDQRQRSLNETLGFSREMVPKDADGKNSLWPDREHARSEVDRDSR